MLESFSKSGFDYQDGVICLQTRNLIINIYRGGGMISQHQTSIRVNYGRQLALEILLHYPVFFSMNYGLIRTKLHISKVIAR